MAHQHQNPLAIGKQPTQRQLRVAEEIRHNLASIFLRGDFTNPELTAWLTNCSITITNVIISPDLKNAKVYVVPLGEHVSEDGTTLSDQDNKQKLVSLLNETAAEIRHFMSKQLTLRYAPQFRFYHDDTFDQAQRINDLIEEAIRRDKNIPSD